MVCAVHLNYICMYYNNYVVYSTSLQSATATTYVPNWYEYAYGYLKASEVFYMCVARYRIAALCDAIAAAQLDPAISRNALND